MLQADMNMAVKLPVCKGQICPWGAGRRGLGPALLEPVSRQAMRKLSL